LILGIGVDLCKISRMHKIVENEHFLSRVFHPCEITYASSKADPAQHYASSFAAREAFTKASGLSLMKTVFQGVWVERTGNGPVLRINENLSDCPGCNNLRIHLSISHEDEFAIAFVVLEVD